MKTVPEQNSIIMVLWTSFFFRRKRLHFEHEIYENLMESTDEEDSIRI